jgi:cyclic beta-1,2-glucan synthetase
VSTTSEETVTPAAQIPVELPEPLREKLAEHEPIRGEIYGLEHLDVHARQVAAGLRVAPQTPGQDLTRHFRQIGQELEQAHRRIIDAARHAEGITADAEWLLDNFHIVAENLREVRQDLPRGYYRELPKSVDGPYRGLPRVYALALELIAHTDSSLDENNVTRFVQSFQAVAPLSIGELWAVPIMLRLGLLENLRRLARQMLCSWADRSEAAKLKERLIAQLDLALQVADRRLQQFVREPQSRWSDPFVVHLLEALRDHGAEACVAIEWLERHLHQQNDNPAEILRREHQRQAANQVTVGNCVTSLRLLSALDWTVFFERSSLVETELRQDPAGVYARQNFATRDRYRRVVEELARGSKTGELAVARRAVEMARAHADSSRDGSGAPARGHCGFYLIGPGRGELEAALSYQPRLADWLREQVLTHPHLFYFGSLALAMAFLLIGVLWCGWLAVAGSGAASATLGLLLIALGALVPLSDLAVGLVHHVITLVLPPRVLPKMDYREGIPADCPTFVVIPALLMRPDSGQLLAERLEIHYLSNPDPQLRFALLTDFADAPGEHMPTDEDCLRAAVERIEALNARYAQGGPTRFFLFHRARRWNPAMNCWMGWERKRGKLNEFNRLLRGARDTSFTTTIGELSSLPAVRFVITLDADTRLQRDAARRLVATITHPLNRPRFEPALGRVVEGHGIIQPRVTLGLAGTTRSLFARFFSGSAGLDPYTTAVSDVYQDLFDKGTFTGKGIYDVATFEATVGNTFPDNHVLSHDLIEGNYARCGLATDIELLDDFPALYPAYARREHRWVRGDWQILPWLFRHVPAADERRRNPLPAVERWKIFDNLRRSLVPPALVLLLILGWTVLPGSPWIWTALTLLVPALPLVLATIGGLGQVIGHGVLELQWRGLRRSLAATAAQVLLGAAFLVEQARLMIDAIGRTLLRLYVTHRQLLEWETAASTERRLDTRFSSYCLNMGLSSVLAAALGGLLVWLRPEALPIASPFLIAWFFAPAVAFWVSRPLPVRESQLTADDRRYLGRLARKTWIFFETFVTATDHWLPPDNFQENPKNQVAHRTSPTNIGLYLLSSLAAHDLGYLSLSALLTRLEDTFDTLDQLERFHGHFYNWYLTDALRPLQPPYVSTVDSGNLLACLVALKQGLREKAEEPILGPRTCLGLQDTLRLVREALQDIAPPVMPEPLGVFRQLDEVIRWLDRRLEQCPPDLAAWRGWLDSLYQKSLELVARGQSLAGLLHERPEELLDKSRRFADQVRERREELASVAPWLELCDPEKCQAWPESWQRWRERLLLVHSAAELHAQAESLQADLAALAALPGTNADLAALLPRFRDAFEHSSSSDLAARCQQLAERATTLAAAMNFRLLYNEQRHLFSIGYNFGLGRLDSAHYDLLGSEACLTSFLTIARGETPRRHWFQLGRPLTRAGDGIALLSWGGTMFEYLMPRLFVRAYPGTLLQESWKSAVARQIEYGREKGVPWGISESGFNALDAALDYQYQSFGVPGLGLKRGLAKDLVVAPYATALALAVEPVAAVRNFRALAAEEADGPYGFHEAVDYSHDVSGEKRRSAVVHSFMAHHQGMTLVALANCLLGDPMPRRVHAEPIVKATELLLQERIPLVAPVYQPHGDEVEPTPATRDTLVPLSRRMTTPDTPYPRVHLLSNQQYSVLVTNAGSGFSTWRDLDVTRWREDRTCDAWGQFCFLRDLRSGIIWSAGHQPIGRVADAYKVVFSTDKAEFHRSDAGIDTHWEIAVSPENNAEVRRVTVTNNNPRSHDLEITSYVEVALSPHRADVAHPAFAKLFLETEYVAGHSALLCRRRPRAADQKPVWAVHVVVVEGQSVAETQYETDRARFVGRGRTLDHSAALEPGAVLSGTAGAVLDPIFSLRRRVRLAPGATATIAFTTAVAESREEALALADQYHDPHGVNRAFELAWAYSQVELRHLHLSPADAHLYQRLAGHLIFAGPSLRAGEAITLNRQGQPGLWRHGISGDKPILLARIADMEELPLVRQLLQAHTYWRLKGLEVDLVLLNEHPVSYREELHEQLLSLVRSSEAHTLMDRPGGVFVRQAAHLSDDDRVLLQAAARVVVAGVRGSLATWIDRQERATSPPPEAGMWIGRRTASSPAERGAPVAERGSALRFANGLGGFTADGREYVIHVNRRIPPGRRGAGAASSAGGWSASAAGWSASAAGWSPDQPPARDQVLARNQTLALPPTPWINVVANPNFGFLISESGSGYTWASNSQTNRLTGWNNDPVSDPPSEVLYLRDEDTGEFWTPTPLPCGSNGTTVVRHGQGATRFVHTSHGLSQELLLLVPPADPIKLICLKVRNPGNRVRRLSATFYAEWVLGTSRDQAPMQVICSVDPESGALLARNPFSADFADAVAFADVSMRPRTFTADRTQFLGRNGSLTVPAALGRRSLAGQVGPALDPCAALMVSWELHPEEEKEIVFFLGQAPNLEEARRILGLYRKPSRAGHAHHEIRRQWDEVLDAVQVHTPNQALDLLLNRWLLYQVLSCRVWSRSAFYQSGGAYGFRDQLQDVMALVYGAPQETRAHILRAASRQFLEGDVQHWWHPPLGRGVRTRFSDDLLWLPFVVCHYVATTGDEAILNENVPFLRAPVLRPDQEEDYGRPDVTQETAPLYEHCVRALEHGYRLGEHGLPLMGTGDWNDGMNRVGAGGRGESVWNGWFLLTILPQFAELAEKRGDAVRAAWWRARAEPLQAAMETHAWDGSWYRRAYFDDGTPLGSKENDECQIDSLAQTWAVISGRAEPQRAQEAMQAVERYLIREADKLILLFTPPFDQGKLQPGYIKGYVPGIRENGGQYTHAATWVVQAMALLGQGTRAVKLFDLLSPIQHSSTPEAVARYKVEPYIVAADVYSQPPHVGRGGWTWYTGSAGWLYRIALETILGFHLRGTTLQIKPCIAADWPRFEITYRYRSAVYHIVVENPHSVQRGVQSVELDGQALPEKKIELVNDAKTHEVRVTLA